MRTIRLQHPSFTVAVLLHSFIRSCLRFIKFVNTNTLLISTGWQSLQRDLIQQKKVYSSWLAPGSEYQAQIHIQCQEVSGLRPARANQQSSIVRGAFISLHGLIYRISFLFPPHQHHEDQQQSQHPRLPSTDNYRITNIYSATSGRCGRGHPNEYLQYSS